MGTIPGDTGLTDPERIFYEIMLGPQSVDPYSGYRRLRERAPVLLTGDGTLVLTRHADCDAALRHRSLGKGGEMLGFDMTAVSRDEVALAMRLVQDSMLFANPPDHTRLRRLVSSAFCGRHVEAMRRAVEARVDDSLRALAGTAGFDFMSEFAPVLPINVIADLLGVPEEDRPGLLPRIRAMDAVFQPGSSPEALAGALQAQTALADYFTGLLAAKRERPGDDLLSRLAASRADDALTESEMVGTAFLLFGAGFQTTAHLLGNALHALLTHPGQWTLLRDEPALASRAVEEFLRYDTPVQVDARSVLEPVTFLGVGLEPGQVVLTLLGAANRDPEQHREPDRLDITRTTAHLAFAAGPHFCLGAPLARMEAEVFLHRLAAGYPDCVLAAPPVRGAGLAFRGFARLPVALAP